jgi:hypothetical protein
MGSALSCLALILCQVPAATCSAPELGSYIVVDGPECACPSVVPYYPQEGDLVFFTGTSKFWKCYSSVVPHSAPQHVGIVVRLCDGSLALLEVCPDSGTLAGPFVCLLDVLERLHQAPAECHVRRLRCPLTPEQSACLTNFAVAQQGKWIAGVRLFLVLTPFKVHGPVRTYCFGKTCTDRAAWICSELVVAAAAAAGLLDPHVYKANAILTYELYEDKTYDLSCVWYPPVRWLATPCAVGAH